MPRADCEIPLSAEIPDAPEDLEGAFASTARTSMDQHSRHSLCRIAKLARARDLLLPRLMNGEIAV